MEKTFILITAQAKIAKDGSLASAMGGLSGIPTLYGENFCGLLSGVVQNICREMSVNVVKSECFEADRRMALIIRADATHIAGSLDKLRTMLELAGEKIHVNVRVQKEDLFRYMHRI